MHLSCIFTFMITNYLIGNTHNITILCLWQAPTATIQNNILKQRLSF